MVAFEDKVGCKSKGLFNWSVMVFDYDKSQVLFEAKKVESEDRIFPKYFSSSSCLKNQGLVFFPFMLCHFWNRI
jgi:hypothetical protein